MDALVTETHTRTAIGGLRALGRSGLRVAALGPHRFAAGLRSRYASAAFVGPDVLTAPGGFAARVASIARDRGPLVVYPVHEEAIDALFDASPALPTHALSPYPGPEPVRRLRDKRALPALAAEHGLRSAHVLAEASAADLASAALPFPCIIKPVGKGGALPTARSIRSQAQLRALLKVLPASEPLIAQEHLQGSMGAVALVLGHDGAIAARFQRLARQTWPRAAGSTALAVSVVPDERLVSRLARTLGGAGYHGLTQVQFIETATGPVLIDINPRFYGSMPLAAACGVNVAAAWHAVAVDAQPAPVGSYSVGVTYHWLEADFLAALRGSPRDLIRRAPAPRVGDTWARDDPLPGFLYSGQIITKRVGRRLAQRHPRRRGRFAPTRADAWAPSAAGRALAWRQRCIPRPPSGTRAWRILGQRPNPHRGQQRRPIGAPRPTADP